MHSYLKLMLVSTVFLGAMPSAQAQIIASRADHPQLMETAKSVPMGGHFVINEIQLDPEAPPQTFILERFSVFTSDAEIIVHGETGPRQMPVPDNAYFYGVIDGNPHARVFLSVLEKGAVRGIVSDRGRFWIAGGGETSGGPLNGMAVVEVDDMDLEHFNRPTQCDADTLIGERLAVPAQGQGAIAKPSKPTASYTAATYNARIAIESDFEFFQKFGNASDTLDYMADIIAFSSTVYSDDLDTSLSIAHTSIWETSGDPWTQFSTRCGLFEFGRYWNNNNGGIDRTLAHFFSGKNNGGGIAWVGVLCDGAFNYNHQGACPSLTPQTSNYGGDYGYSGDMDGNFNINNPAVVWDIVVVAHEIGHNFNSPHSHCYANIGGNSSPVDQCNAGQCGQTGCHCGGTSLPCGTAGAGCGTIMSYCHLLSGGLGNISMTFGIGHPHGTAPERVAQRMGAAVISAHNSNPSCIPQNATLPDFLDTWPTEVSVLDLIPFVNP